MARESQGVQIALIVFVMLSVVLGVTTFLCVQQNGELLRSRKDAVDRATAADANVKAVEADNAALKTMMVGVSDKPMAGVKAAYEEDIKKYAADLPEEMQAYTKIAQRQYEAIKKRDADITNASKELADYQKEFAGRQEASAAQVAQIAGQFSEVKSGLATMRSNYEGEEATHQQLDDTNLKQLEEFKGKQNRDRADAAEKEKQYRLAMLQQQQESGALAQKLRELTTPNLDHPCGEISTVDQRSRIVWLNRGREDHLGCKTKFGVYASDGPNMSNVKKADIEVVAVVDDHTSKARILDDSINNPIVQGDKIYTPLWTPGEQTHYALAGVMDLDGDGNDAGAKVRDLIASNGAVVDCYIDDNGNLVGALSAATRYVVLGAPGAGKNSAKSQRAYDNIVAKADRLAATKITLAEFKEKMDYKKLASVDHFASSSNP